MRIPAALLLLLYLVVASSSYGQKYYLSHGNKKVFISRDYARLIGLTTKSDTIEYAGNEYLSYELYKISLDTIVVRKPVRHHEIEVLCDSSWWFTAYRDSKFIDDYKTGGKKYCRYAIIDSFEYSSYPVSTITSIQYPPEASNMEGCMGCILVPGYNIYFLHKISRRWKPQTYNMSRWKLKVQLPE